MLTTKDDTIKNTVSNMKEHLTEEQVYAKKA